MKDNILETNEYRQNNIKMDLKTVGRGFKSPTVGHGGGHLRTI
jgi:hypothetical protein